MYFFRHWIESFILPLAVTVLLHAIVIAAMIVGWESEPAKHQIKRPNFVKATLVTLESKTAQKNKKVTKKPKIVDLTKKRKEQERKKKLAEQKRKKQLKRKKEAEQKKVRDRKAKEKAKKKAEDERKKQETLKRQQLKQQQQAFDQALEEEQRALEEESYAVAAQSYMAAIAQRIEQNWSRPPSARNGMECELKILLVPTGRVIDVDVIKSSGNVQFDRSAEQAVKKVEQFPEIKKMETEVFERYYRELTLVFRPQDLRQ